MKSLIKGAFFLALVGTTIVGCEKDSINSEIELEDSQKSKTKLQNEKTNSPLSIETHNLNTLDLTYIEGDYSFEIQSTSAENILNSTLIIKEVETTNVVYENSISINYSDSDYKKFTRNVLVENANNLLDVITLENLTLQNFSTIGESILFEFSLNLDESLYFAESTQSVFYQISVIRMLDRAKANQSTDCKCSTFNKYTYDESSFICTEDLKYESSFVHDYFSELYDMYDSLVLDSLGINAIIDSSNNSSFLTQNTIELLAVQDAIGSPFSVNDTTKSTERISCQASNSASLGCCGNNGPSEPCKRCRIICLLHDLACYRCGQNTQLGSIFCGPNCIPED